MDSPKQKSAESAAASTDEELDALLDSALDDFDKPLPKTPSSEVPKAATEKEASCSEESSTNVDGATWSNEFEQFQDTMKTFFGQNPQLKKELEDIAKSADDASSSNISGDDFAASLAETLKGLAENTQNMADPPIEDLSRLLADLGMGESGKGDDQVPDIMPFMQNVMQNLLSKELLYPALKDIVDKYPDWLTKNQHSVEQPQFEKYSRQYELMKQVCQVFESEESSSEDDKQATFEKVFVLMQKMQDCGQPPKELVGEMTPDLPFDEQGNLKLPGMSDQCCVM